MHQTYKKIPSTKMRRFYTNRYNSIESMKYESANDKELDLSELTLLIYLGTIHQDALIQTYIGNLKTQIQRRFIYEADI